MTTGLRTAGQTYTMLGSSPIWDTARRCDELMRRCEIPYALVGGVAVCLHGYQRNTVDVDLLIRREDSAAIRRAFEAAGFVWNEPNRELRTSDGVAVQFLVSQEPASDDASFGIMLPDPREPNVTMEIEGLAVLSLPRLIELKIACGLGNLRRMHRDFADVVELIIVHSLGRDFARYLHKTIRKDFRELVRQARNSAQPDS